MTLLQHAIEDSLAMTHALGAQEAPLKRATEMVARCLTSGHRLLVCGNAGSASDATHLATECGMPGLQLPRRGSMEAQ